MTDVELLEKKLARIDSCLRDLRALAKPEAIQSDVLQQRFIEHTLQIALQAVLDVASHIVSDERLGEPASNHELFALLHRGGWLKSEDVPSLKAMTGFRNVLVHEYDDVDLRIVRDIVEHRLGDIEGFATAIRARIARPA